MAWIHTVGGVLNPAKVNDVAHKSVKKVNGIDLYYKGKYNSTTSTYFSRRKKITINSSADGALTNYQIKLDITYESSMQADFDDIRFGETNGNYIYYWIEYKTNSSSARVWIKTDVPASGGKTIWMYYGNSSLSHNKEVRNVFIYGDDFVGGTEQWTENDTGTTITIDRTTNNRVDFSVAGGDYEALYIDNTTDLDNVIIEAHRYHTAIGRSNLVGNGLSDTLDWISQQNDCVLQVVYTQRAYAQNRWPIYLRDEGSATVYGAAGTFLNTHLYTRLVRTGNTVTGTLYSDAARTSVLNTGTDNSQTFTGMRYLYAVVNYHNDPSYTTAITGWITDITVRKYTANPPTTSTGSEV